MVGAIVFFLTSAEGEERGQDMLPWIHRVNPCQQDLHLRD